MPTLLQMDSYGNLRVRLHIPVPSALSLVKEQCHACIKSRTLELTIKNHLNHHYLFKLTRLYADLKLDVHKIKFKADKVVLTVEKKLAGKHWGDVQMKKVSDVVYQLQRTEANHQANPDSTDKCVNEALFGPGHQTWKYPIETAEQNEELSKQNNAQDPFYLPDLGQSSLSSVSFDFNERKHRCH
ncbi:hypothetical protein DM01DRAFT_1380885 [Hesseltinella vesiculosa]|uniref:CS domain-containing protein n=1 Tax=Hesseltinella vesiculosa TaxID=101127 RepID=A0A1X2GSX5_9FUNG|nr:hypothetical protein DM01DRAFT_1380885 [Hesseltinella vesiculosa]